MSTEVSILAFSVWCLAALLFLIHAAMIGDAVFISLQAVNLVAGGVIVWFSKKYEGDVCPFARFTEGTSCRLNSAGSTGRAAPISMRASTHTGS